MTGSIDETHRPELISWVASANDLSTDFPVQNLALGVFRLRDGRPRPGVAIGDQILDLTATADAKLLDAREAQLVGACSREGGLNPSSKRGRADANATVSAQPVGATIWQGRIAREG